MMLTGSTENFKTGATLLKVAWLHPFPFGTPRKVITGKSRRLRQKRTRLPNLIGLVPYQKYIRRLVPSVNKKRVENSKKPDPDVRGISVVVFTPPLADHPPPGFEKSIHVLHYAGQLLGIKMTQEKSL